MLDFSAILAQIKPILSHFDDSFLEYAEIIAKHTTVARLPEGQRFPLPEQVGHQGVFIVEGVMGVYSVDETGKETIIRLVAEGDFTMYLEDYAKLTPDINYHWETLTEATVLTWGMDEIEFLARHVPNWYWLNLKITQTVILRFAIERGQMLNDDATTRYIKFSRNYPHVISRIPLRIVANYLGIAPQSLSRIRQKLAEEKKS